MRENPVLFQKREQEAFFQHKEHEKEQTPQHKIPACAVPEARGRPHDKQVKNGAVFPLAVAAQRNIQIFAEPASQRDMPAPPELRNTARRVGEPEIFREFEAKQPPKPDRHQGITAEIKIDLQGIGEDPEPRKRHGQPFIADRRHLIPELADLVRQQDLAPQSEQEYSCSLLKILRCNAAAVEFLVDIGIFDDRPRDQLRKQADERRKIEQIAFRLYRSPVDVDAVRHGLKRIKADPQRKRHTEHRRGKAERAEIIQEKPGVFEKAETAQIEYQRQPQKCPCPPSDAAFPAEFYPEPGAVIRQDRRKHQQDKTGFPPCVKNQAGDQDNRVFQPERAEIIYQ